MSTDQLVTRGGPAWRRQHRQIRDLAEHVGDWAGIPMPLDGFDVRLQDRHPHKAAFEKILNKAPAAAADPRFKETHSPSADDAQAVRVRNTWYSWRRACQVTLYEEAGVIKAHLDPWRRGAERLTYWLSTMGASQAWSYDAELEARRKLATMIKPHLMEMYELTGSFFETSKQSGVSYVLRRARPTVAMVPIRRGPGSDDLPMKVLAVLCLHPLAYYAGTWAGAMVPTDDVIAHLLMIRGDEHGFWRRANQHNLDSAEAGL